MSRPTRYLELRPTGYFWRRRAPAALARSNSNLVFCFPLKAHVWRDAAAVAHRLTAISDICFRSEIDVPPEVMTRLLTTYARLEIETADKLRALTGPRTRAAAEASLAVEAAIRNSLRESILVCERDPAIRAIESTARHLGLEITGDDADLPVLTDKMMRLMLELSDERERRARGYFAEPQPFLSMALAEMREAAAVPSSPATSMAFPPATAAAPRITAAPPLAAAPEAPHHGPDVAQPNGNVPVFASRRTAEPVNVAPQVEAVAASPDPVVPASASPDDGIASTAAAAPGLDEPRADILFEDDTKIVRFRPVPADIPPDSGEPTLLQLFDLWFEQQSEGIFRQGELQVVDQTVAQSFARNADTTRSTRKLLAGTIGGRKMSDLAAADWQNFFNLLLRIPKNHGKSPKDRDKTYLQLVTDADKKEASAKDKAAHQAKRNGATAAKTKAMIDACRVARLSPRTIQRHQMTLAAAFDHAVDLGRIPVNGFRAFVLQDKTVDIMQKGRPDTRRKLWGDEFYNLLRTKAWTSQKTRIDDEIYWAPLIARLEGMRSEEVLQLETGNIRCDEGIWYFDITQGTGQSLKSNNARRLIPIHSQLIELGILHLVEHQRKRGERRLFPRASRAKTAKLSYSANFTKRLTYYRKTHRVYEARMDYHALRTTFNSALVADGVPDTARRYLMGHENPDVGIVSYLPEGFPLATLAAIINRRQLDLSMVTRRFGRDPTAPGLVLAVSNVLPMARARRSRTAS